VVKVSGANAEIFNGTNYLGAGNVSLPGSNNIPIVASVGTNRTEANRTVYMPSAKPQVFLWDANGNLTNDGQRAYYWDDENRLVAIETHGDAGIPACEKKRSEYLYDAQWRRVRKADLSGWNGSAYATTNVTGYVWSGWLLLAETDAAGSVSAYHVHGLDVAEQMGAGVPRHSAPGATAGGIGGLLARVQSGTNYCYTFDGNGNVADVVADSGATAAHYEYDPFGRTVAQSGAYADANPWRFSTKQMDEWGLCYYGYRYFSPETGRWLSRDPLGDVGLLSNIILRQSVIGQYEAVWISMTVNANVLRAQGKYAEADTVQRASHAVRRTAEIYLQNQIALTELQVYTAFVNDPVNHVDILGLDVDDCKTKNEIPSDIYDSLPPWLKSLMEKSCWKKKCLGLTVTCCYGGAKIGDAYVVCIKCNF
jgi:RHS repeat-associated protein